LDPEDALGMSACHGILQEHRGRVFRERREDGSLFLCMELPATGYAPETAKGPTVPVLWQSQPSAYVGRRRRRCLAHEDAAQTLVSHSASRRSGNPPPGRPLGWRN